MKNLADVFIGLSMLAVLFSIIGAFGTDLWLASTQWVLIAATLAVWAVYAKMRA